MGRSPVPKPLKLKDAVPHPPYRSKKGLMTCSSKLSRREEAAVSDVVSILSIVREIP
jgi:hypothetical protein